MKIGILTDPSKTFIYPCGTIYRLKYRPSMFEDLPEDYKNEKQCFLRFLGGNFSEVLTLVDELFELGQVEVMLYLGEHFIHQDEEISPRDVYHLESTSTKSRFDAWMGSLDILIISLSNQYIKCFEDTWPGDAQLPVIGVGGKTQKEIFTSSVGNLGLFLLRKGVARFGKNNREKISEFIKDNSLG